MQREFGDWRETYLSGLNAAGVSLAEDGLVVVGGGGVVVVSRHFGVCGLLV